MIELTYYIGSDGFTYLVYFVRIESDGKGMYNGTLYEFATAPEILKEIRNPDREALIECFKESLEKKHKGSDMKIDTIVNPRSAMKCCVHCRSKEMDKKGILPREYFKYFVISFQVRNHESQVRVYPIAATNEKVEVESEIRQGSPSEILDQKIAELKERHSELSTSVEPVH